MLSNAVKFTEEGYIAVEAVERNGVVELAVEDSGIGIPAADLPHIFDEFRQVDGGVKTKEGTGLGLAIAKKSVELGGEDRGGERGGKGVAVLFADWGLCGVMGGQHVGFGGVGHGVGHIGVAFVGAVGVADVVALGA